VKTVNKLLTKITEINFYKIFNFLKPFYIAKRFQTFQNALKALKNHGRCPYLQAFEKA